MKKEITFKNGNKIKMLIGARGSPLLGTITPSQSLEIKDNQETENKLIRILRVLRQASKDNLNYECGNCSDCRKIENKIRRILNS